MTREQMLKTNWKPYMKIEFKTPSMELPILCMLCSINFESEVITLIPFDTEYYEKDEVLMSLEYITIPRPQPRKVN